MEGHGQFVDGLGTFQLVNYFVCLYRLRLVVVRFSESRQHFDLS